MAEDTNCAAGAAATTRRIRSFVVRSGRAGPGQARARSDLGPRFVLAFAGDRLDPRALFGRVAPLVVEIGFGMGAATAAIAAANPGVDYLGIEVHPPGVGALLKQIGERQLANIRIVEHDAVDVLEQMIAPGSLAAIHVFFPDPWPKKRHHKRRLLQAPFVQLLASRLAAGGRLHIATDWEPYAAATLDVLAAEPALRNSVAGYADRPPSRPLTKFEARGIGLGHRVFDLVFVRTDAASA